MLVNFALLLKFYVMFRLVAGFQQK